MSLHPTGAGCPPWSSFRLPAGARAGAVTGDPLESLACQFDGDGLMGAVSAGRRTKGGTVMVAVLDTGTDLGHPALAPNL